MAVEVGRIGRCWAGDAELAAMRNWGQPETGDNWKRSSVSGRPKDSKGQAPWPQEPTSPSYQLDDEAGGTCLSFLDPKKRRTRPVKISEAPTSVEMSGGW